MVSGRIALVSEVPRAWCRTNVMLKEVDVYFLASFVVLFWFVSVFIVLFFSLTPALTSRSFSWTALHLDEKEGCVHIILFVKLS